MYKQALITGIIFAASAVIIGAFGAHFLKTIFNAEQLLSFETGVRYQFYHSFALILTGIIAWHYPSKFIKIATILFSLGIVLFSGSIYVLNFLASKDIIGLKGLGILTPVGGLLFISAWICLGLGLSKTKL